MKTVTKHSTGSYEYVDAAVSSLFADDEECMQVDVTSRCELGDLWQLGNHRVLCGDSSIDEDVELLMGDSVADLVFSDPPYGYSYSSAVRKRTARFSVLQNDDRINSSYLRFLEKYSRGWVIICTSWKVVSEWMDACKPLGELTNMIVWDKGGGGIGYLSHTLVTDYELLLAYGRGTPISGKRVGTVWHIRKDFNGSYQHPTQKPIALYVVTYNSFCEPGCIVYDPFLGSGSAIIAAEQTCRSCYGIEIDPVYCDVSLARWEKCTGRTAVLIKRGGIDV